MFTVAIIIKQPEVGLKPVINEGEVLGVQLGFSMGKNVVIIINNPINCKLLGFDSYKYA